MVFLDVHSTPLIIQQQKESTLICTLSTERIFQLNVRDVDSTSKRTPPPLCDRLNSKQDLIGHSFKCGRGELWFNHLLIIFTI